MTKSNRKKPAKSDTPKRRKAADAEARQDEPEETLDEVRGLVSEAGRTAGILMPTSDAEVEAYEKLVGVPAPLGADFVRRTTEKVLARIRNGTTSQEEILERLREGLPLGPILAPGHPQGLARTASPIEEADAPRDQRSRSAKRGRRKGRS